MPDIANAEDALSEIPTGSVRRELGVPSLSEMFAEKSPVMFVDPIIGSSSSQGTSVPSLPSLASVCEKRRMQSRSENTETVSIVHVGPFCILLAN